MDVKKSHICSVNLFLANADELLGGRRERSAKNNISVLLPLSAAEQQHGVKCDAARPCGLPCTEAGGRGGA